MQRLFEVLRPFMRLVTAHPAVILLLALLISVGTTSLAIRLRIDTDLANLIPASYPSVQALETLRQTVGGESEAAVAIISPSFESNVSFAEAFVAEAMRLRPPDGAEPYFTRYEFRKDTRFLQDNALYFGTNAELDSLESFLNDRIEEAKLDANPFFIDLEDDEEDESEPADDDRLTELRDTYDSLVGTEYPISEDSTTLVLRFYPSGSQTNIGFIEELYDDLQLLGDRMEPATYHPSMEIVFAGRLLRQLVEVRTIRNDVLSSFGAGVSAVLLIVVLYFSFKAYQARRGSAFSGRLVIGQIVRMPVMAMLIGIPLLMSLSWTFAVAYAAFGVLNLMTSTLGLVLFGLGIDYGIHFYARYSELRAAGSSVESAAMETFSSTGQAIAVGALSTAAALYVLVVADFRGFSEFGFVAGTGILLALLSMLVVMPALLALLERIGLLNLASLGDRPPRAVVGSPIRLGRGAVVLSMVAVLAGLAFLPPEFEYRFGELEPSYSEYNAKNDILGRVKRPAGKRNPAYIVVEDPVEVEPIVDALEQRRTADTLSPTILSVETLQDRYPLTMAKQRERLDRLARIRELLDDPFLDIEESEDLGRLRRAAQTVEPIPLDSIPDFLRKRFESKTGQIGNLVIVYPSVGLSDGRNSIAFSDDVGVVTTAAGRTYYAGSTALVSADMLRLMQREAPWMVLATFVIVIVLMAANFGSVRWSVLAILPLVVGVLWMLLLVGLLGPRINFYNLIVLPAVLGIGNDAGVHLVHRYRELGPGSLRFVLRTTGEHITMGSVTTMMGFAGPLLSFHPGLNTIGQLAVVGIGATLVAALVFLPALLQTLEIYRSERR